MKKKDKEGIKEALECIEEGDKYNDAVQGAYWYSKACAIMLRYLIKKK